VHTLELDRRRLFQAAGAGAAAITIAGGWQLIEGVAEAAPLPAWLRRSTWTTLGDGALELLVGERAFPLRLTAVADLPVAGQIPALRGHDGAFALRFDGPAGIGQGTHRLRHAQLGELELFLAPVERDGATRGYEAVVDRTIRIAGVNEEGQPEIAPPGPRAGQPESGPGSTTGGGSAARPRKPPRLTRATLRRGAARRVVVADLTLADAGTVASVRASLVHDGRVAARAAARVRASRSARLRFAAGRRRTFARGRHELVLTFVGRDGRTTIVRSAVRVA
jgi:hypothetical protein